MSVSVDVFRCPRCGYETKSRYCIKQHIERKTPCRPVFLDLSVEQIYEQHPAFLAKQWNDKKKRFECPDCLGKFTTQPGLSRHMNHHCKHRMPSVSCVAEDRLQLLEKQNEQLRQQMQELMEKGSTTTNNTQMNCNNTYIQINAFGRDQSQYVLDDKLFMNACLRKREKGMVDYLQRLHFDQQHPENHNIKVTNYKMPFIDVYDGTRWIKSDKEDVLEDLLDEGCSGLDMHYEENKDELAEHFTANMFRMIEEFLEKVKDRDTHMKLFQDLKRKIYLMMLNESKNDQKKVDIKQQ